MAQTRLAIVDPTPAGAQPMIDAGSGNVIVFNGEIYNHADLRADIETAVGSWQGACDTETLLKAYTVFGLECLSRLKGMFAFAIYDRQRGRVVLVRDRLGIKPLYFSRGEEGVLFCSEVRPLVDAAGGKAAAEGIAAFLRFGAIPNEHPLFNDIRSLPPATYAICSVEGDWKQERYWSPGYSPRPPNKTPARHVRELLERAVSEHLLADVPIASFLSGGIDSSVVTGLAAKFATKPLATFSVGFPQREFDETEVAKRVARRCGTVHTRIELSEPEVLQMVREAVAAMDLPSVEAINTYVVSKVVAQAGIKVALTGLGGDELFGGYPSFDDVRWLRVVARLPAVGRAVLRLAGTNGRRLAEVPPTENAATLAVWRRFHWTQAMLKSAGLPYDDFRQDSLPEWADDFAQISWAELTRYTRQTLLRDADQMGMAVGLELRVPFLDHVLVEYVMSLPRAVKVRRGHVKSLLVDSCRDLLPPEVFERPKMGFGLPFDDWMRGPLRDFVQVGLDGLIATHQVEVQAVRHVQRQFESRQIHWNRLWLLVVLGHYLRKIGVNGTRPP